MSFKSRRMFVYRYSLVPPPQTDLTHKPIPSPKGRVILDALQPGQQNTPFRYWNRAYAWVGFFDFDDLAPPAQHDSRYYVGRIAKHRAIDVADLVPGDVLGAVTDTWEAVWAVFDVETQLVVVQHKHHFGAAKQVANVLSAGLAPTIEKRYGLRLFIEPVSDPATFWKVIKDHDALYRIRLNLVSPNILETNKEARAALENVKALFGNDELTVQLDSRAGTLTAAKETLQNWLEYIGLGEGWWELTVKNDSASRKKVFHSRNTAKETQAAMPNEDQALGATEEEREAIKARTAQGLVDSLRGVHRELTESADAPEKQE